jgi:mannose-6-phosphate isomerase-like protein (cupin superfamily)
MIETSAAHSPILAGKPFGMATRWEAHASRAESWLITMTGSLAAHTTSCSPSSAIVSSAATRRQWTVSLAALMCFTLNIAPARAQTTGSVFPQGRVLQAVERLRAQLKDPEKAAEGLAEERLDDVTRVAMRSKSGRGEIHAKSDDVFFILSGEATLVTGGSVTHPTGQEEVRGDTIEGGSSAPLKPGDVVHIPHTVPHQVLLKPGELFTYVLIKIPR